MFFPQLVFASIFIASCVATFTLGATLANNEVEALKSIANKLGKTDWNFNIDPCSWEKVESGDYANNVTCDCSFNSNTTCHVTSIRLKAQNLSGTLPLELIRLPYLQEIDLTRNYLRGTIPPEWGSMQLINISLLGNRLTGTIPEELANISTLTSLVLEENNFSGPLPPVLANLSNIERMVLNSNKFSGELPPIFAMLTTLKEFQIGDNNFTGKIPDFIFGNWTKLEKLSIQASGLSGPIPAIVGLQNLYDLRISDLNGADAVFPKLSNLPKLKRLILSRCKFIGPLPGSLGELTVVRILDLSFNSLSGEIPSTLLNLVLGELDQLFLTGNKFTGLIPRWILNAIQDIDLSYNNFTTVSSCQQNSVHLSYNNFTTVSRCQQNRVDLSYNNFITVSSCQQKGVNLFASTSGINNSGTVSCLGSLNCPAEPLYSLYINCGGREEIVNGNTYEGDFDEAGPSTFFRSDKYWATSSTGVFLDDDRSKDNLIIALSNNNGVSKSDSQLYTTARLSPNSLTYYAFCLENGTYRVNLHFAEIQFTDDKTFSSLGRRIFDVYIQGKRELMDFNIKDEAGGAGIPIVKFFTTNVTDSTLEIRLRWAGKGSTSIPTRGVYGPLISAISVNADFINPSENRNSISPNLEIGIVAGAAFATILIVGILWWKGV